MQSTDAQGTESSAAHGDPSRRNVVRDLYNIYWIPFDRRLVLVRNVPDEITRAKIVVQAHAVSIDGDEPQPDRISVI